MLRCGYVLYLEDFTELFEFDWYKLSEPNNCPRSRSSASENLRPFRVTIHNNKVVEIFQGTRKINM